MKLQFFVLTFLIISCSSPNQEQISGADTLNSIDSLPESDTITKKIEKLNPIKVDFSNEIYPVELTDNNLEIIIDTVVNKAYLKNSHLESFKFKLPTLKRRTNYPNVTFYNDSIELTINTNKFQKDNHEITYDKVFIEKIDGRYPWGIDGNVPISKVKSIQLKKYGNEVAIPDSIYNDLYEPNITCDELEHSYFCYIEGYVSKKGEIILHMMNGDAAGSYTAFIFISPDNSVERIIGHSF